MGNPRDLSDAQVDVMILCVAAQLGLLAGTATQGDPAIEAEIEAQAELCMVIIDKLGGPKRVADAHIRLANMVGIDPESLIAHHG